MTTVVDKAAASEMNLAVLKRMDPEIEQILGSAAHVCLYVMSVEKQQWERKNVEGSLYLLKRRSAPRFQIMVLNKLATENYTEVVHGGFETEVSGEYLMYTQGDGKVHGIWFYDQNELNSISALLNKIKTTLPQPDAGAPQVGTAAPRAAPAVTAPPQGSGDDNGFWDKKVEVKDASSVPLKPGFEQPQLQQQPQQQQQGGAPLTALFKNAQLKQQHGGVAAAVTRPQVPASPVATAVHPFGSPMPLPPSYFQQQQQQVVAQQQVVPPPALAAGAAAAENPLQKFFGKSASGAPAPAVSSSPPTPAQGSVLNALFAGAAQKAGPQQQQQQQGRPPAPQQPVPQAIQQVSLPQPQSPQMAAAAAAAQAPWPGSGQQDNRSQQPAQAGAATQQAGSQTDRLRVALSRLVQREGFIQMLEQELRGVGLL